MKPMRRLNTFSFTLLLFLLDIRMAPAAEDAAFLEGFNSSTVQPGWTTNVSAAGKVEAKDNWGFFESTLNGNAHLERPARADSITLSARIVRWGAIYIIWDENNWCSVGKLSPTPFGRFFNIETVDGKSNEVDHRGLDFHSGHSVRIQLGSDHIAFQQHDGKQWVDLRRIERPKQFAGAPKLIAAGKYYPGEHKPFSKTPPQSDDGNKISGLIDDIRVETTPASELKLTDSQLAAVRNPPRERVNAVLDEGEEDPTYERIVHLYPSMKAPREVVGVPTHPLDIGVDRLGRLDVSPWTPPLAWFTVGDANKSFGQEGVPFTRRLLRGYLPVLTLSRDIDGLTHEMTVFGWSEGFRADKDLIAFVRFTVHSASGGPLPSNISLSWANGGKKMFPLTQGQAFFRFKYPEPAAAFAITPQEFQSHCNETVAFWENHLKPADRFEIPDTRVSEAYKAWIVYSMLNADTINGFVEPHDGAGFYEEMFGNSVSLNTVAMNMYGFHDYAARILDTQIHFQQTNGLYTQVCGLTDPGGFLFGLARHYQMTGDKAWLRRVSPAIVKQCQWLMEQRALAPKEGMTRGLIKFRPYNDYPDPVYNYLGNVWCAKGMELAGVVLKDIEVEGASMFAAEAAKYGQDILDSMDASAFTHEGQTLLPMEPDTHRLFKLSKYKGGDYWGLIASPLLGIGFLPPTDKRATWIVDLLEKRGGLIAGVCEFQNGIDHAYTFGYLVNAMKRGEPRKTLLGFWSMFAFGMTRDTYSPVEVTQIVTGENHYTLPHLYSCTDQLRLLRNLLFREDGDVLWIGEGIPRAWLESGKQVAVTRAPSEFGEVTYRLDPQPDGTLRVHVTPPSRRPAEIRVRLRHPQRQSIASLRALPQTGVEFTSDTIVLRDLKTPVDVLVDFGGNHKSARK